MVGLRVGVQVEVGVEVDVLEVVVVVVVVVGVGKWGAVTVVKAGVGLIWIRAALRVYVRVGVG